MLESHPAERLIFAILKPAIDLLREDRVTEILLNGHDRLFIEESGKLRSGPTFLENEEKLGVLLRLIAQRSGRVLHDDDFELDASLNGPPALRIHANFGPTSPQGVCLSLRKLARRRMTLEVLETKYSALTTDARNFLSDVVRARRNVLISGGTGVGKTALLNALAAAIPEDERIVLIEDTQEIDLPQLDVVPLTTRKPDIHGRGEVTIRDLFRSALRMRPDRLIIGEVRGGEAFDLVQSLGSGHSGSLTTVHADSPTLALSRLHSLAMMSGVAVSSAVLRRQVSEVIGTVVQLARFSDGSRKVIQIDQLNPSDENSWQLRPVFVHDLSGGSQGWLQRVSRAEPS